MCRRMCIITVGGWFELFFVNTLNCPFNTGVIIYIIVLVATVIWAIRESYIQKNKKRENISLLLSIALLGIPFYGYGWSAAVIGIVLLAVMWFVLRIKRDGKELITSRLKNTTLLCLLMLMIGYSTYAVIVVSHDRYFTDKVVDHLLVFHGGGEIQDFPGNYSQYREYMNIQKIFAGETKKEVE